MIISIVVHDIFVTLFVYVLVYCFVFRNKQCLNICGFAGSFVLSLPGIAQLTPNTDPNASRPLGLLSIRSPTRASASASSRNCRSLVSSKSPGEQSTTTQVEIVDEEGQIRLYNCIRSNNALTLVRLLFLLFM